MSLSFVIDLEICSCCFFSTPFEQAFCSLYSHQDHAELLKFRLIVNMFTHDCTCIALASYINSYASIKK